MAFIRNGHILETVGNQQETQLAEEILKNPQVIQSQDGYINLPTTPGLGVELNLAGILDRPFKRYYQTTR